MTSALRCYDFTDVPPIGRFTQTDPIVGNRPFMHCAYGANNPLSHIDPLGLQKIPTLEEERRQEIEFLERRLKEEGTGFWNMVRSLDPFGGGLNNGSEFQVRRLRLKGQAGEFWKRTGGEAGIWMHTITAVSPQQVASRIVAGKDLVTQKEVGANERAMEALLVLTPPGVGPSGPARGGGRSPRRARIDGGGSEGGGGGHGRCTPSNGSGTPR